MKLEIAEVSTRLNWNRGHRRSYRYPGNYEHARIFFHPVGETVLENLFEGRWTRPYQDLRKLIPAAMEMVIKENEDRFHVLVTPDLKYKSRWSQRAGCSCPCSPGFILENVKSKYNISVDYRIVEE